MCGGGVEECECTCSRGRWIKHLRGIRRLILFKFLENFAPVINRWTGVTLNQCSVRYARYSIALNKSDGHQKLRIAYTA